MVLKSLFCRDSKKDFAKLDRLRKMADNPTFEASESYLKSLTKLLKYYRKDGNFAYNACHAISIVALEESNAEFLMSLDIMKPIVQILSYHKDKKRCLVKACAALWNLLGVSDDDCKIPTHCFELLWCTLLRHRKSKQVVHTAIGALANLAVATTSHISASIRSKYLQTLKDIVNKYTSSADICSHFGAFVANICVNQHNAEKCISLDFVQFLVKLLRSKCSRVPQVQKHLLAALHNLADVSGFLEYFSICNGIETLKSILDDSNDQDISNYIDAILNHASISESATTSLHIAAVGCKLESVVCVLMNNDIDIDETDADGFTACDLAIQNGKDKVVEVLVASGASFNQDVFTELGENDKKRINRSVNRGNRHRNKSRKAIKTLVTKHSKMICDMGSVITEFIPGVEMLLILN